MQVVSIFLFRSASLLWLLSSALSFVTSFFSISIWLDWLSNLIFWLVTSTFSFSSSTGLAPLLINIWLLPLLAIKDNKQEYNTWNKAGVVNCLCNPGMKLYLHFILWDNVLLSFLNCWINHQVKILWIKGISFFILNLQTYLNFTAIFYSYSWIHSYMWGSLLRCLIYFPKTMPDL